MELVVLTHVPPRYDWERPHQIAARLPKALSGGDGEHRVVWLSTPACLPEARALAPDLLVYDVTGYLPGYRAALDAADVVVTGGRSLQRAITTIRPDAHCFASGVDAAHLARAAALRSEQAGRRPVAGYAGVVDERLDWDLVRELAAALPDWDIRVVEPASYADQPAVLAEFDVGLLPFALNGTTPSVSPIKALEYLAAGLPVVATRIPDVADAFSDVVALADGGSGFATACVRAANDCAESRAARAKPLLRWHEWDAVTARMAQVISARVAELARADRVIGAPAQASSQPGPRQRSTEAPSAASSRQPSAGLLRSTRATTQPPKPAPVSRAP